MKINYFNPTCHPCKRLTIDDSVYDLDFVISQIFTIKKDQKLSIYKDDCVTWKITANTDFIIAYFENRVWFHMDHTKEQIAQDKLAEDNWKKYQKDKKKNLS